MFFSVIIPTCNRNELLVKCLIQLQPEVQTLKGVAYEIIVTDDSAGEGAAGLIAEQFPWVQWVTGPRRGPAANRNNGARLAKGEWLVFLDDDCEPERGLLEAYEKAIISQNSCCVFEGCIYSTDEMDPLLMAPVNLTGGYLWSCNFLIKRDIFFKIGLFDENFRYANLEDNDLRERIKFQNLLIHFVKEAKVFHAPRQMPGPKQFAKYHESWLYFYHKYHQHKTIKDLVVTIIKTRVSNIKAKKKSLKSVQALWYLMLEIIYTVWESRKWNILSKKVK